MKRILWAVLLLSISFTVFTGCEKTQLGDDPDPTTSSERPEKIIFASSKGDGSALYQMNVDGQGQEQIQGIPENAYGPMVSPDGKILAFYCHVSSSQWSIYTLDLSNKALTQLTNDPKYMDWSISWSPDSRSLYFTRSSMNPEWQSEIWHMQSDGSGLERIIEAQAQGGTCAPDGKALLYFDYVEGGGDIYLYNLADQSTERLTTDGAENWWPSWAPDGQSIVFQSKREGDFEIYRMDLKDKAVSPLTESQGEDGEPQFSPSGKTIVFSSMRDGHYEIYRMNADGKETIRLTHSNGHSINPSWVHP